MTDERALLRTDLEAGRWERLTDPLLPLALLEDASWWSRARSACAGHLLMALQGHPAAREARWEWLCTRMTLGRDDAWISPRVQCVVLGWATERAKARQAFSGELHAQRADMLAALDVMRQLRPGR